MKELEEWPIKFINTTHPPENCVCCVSHDNVLPSANTLYITYIECNVCDCYFFCLNAPCEHLRWTKHVILFSSLMQHMQFSNKFTTEIEAPFFKCEISWFVTCKKKMSPINETLLVVTLLLLKTKHPWFFNLHHVSFCCHFQLNICLHGVFNPLTSPPNTH